MSVTLWRWGALTGLLGLFLLLALRTAWLAPPLYWPRPLVLILLVGPLLLPMRGVVHGRASAHLWAAILAMFYFVVGIYHFAGAEPGGEPYHLAVLEILLSLLLFISANLYVRAQPRGAGSARYRVQ